MDIEFAISMPNIGFVTTLLWLGIEIVDPDMGGMHAYCLQAIAQAANQDSTYPLDEL